MVECNCNPAGLVAQFGGCDKVQEGKLCECKERVKGRICNQCKDLYWNLQITNPFGYQYEAEDWRNPTGSPARFGYEESKFPEYSWRGYATFTDLQKEIITNLTIQKHSIYRAIIRFVNLNSETISGSLTFTPSETFGETQQSSSILFEPTKEPKRLYVVGKPGLIIAPLVLNPGQWEVSLKADKNDLLVDYLVLIPQAYFDQTILQERFNEPCTLSKQHMCRHYAYPQLPEDSSVARGQSAFLSDGDARSNAKVFNDGDILRKLDYEGSLALLDKEQQTIMLDLSIDKSNTYAFIISYHNPNLEGIENKESVQLVFETKGPEGNVMKTETIGLADCPYTFICRQMVTDKSGQISTYDLDSNFVQLTLRLPETTPESYQLGVEKVAPVPYPNDWSMDNMIPRFVCIKKNGECIESAFSVVPEANKVGSNEYHPN